MGNKKIVSLLMVILILFILHAPIFALGGRVLKYGSTGSDVRELQRQLKQIGYYYGGIDGIYGKQLEKAVIRFQRDFGLRIDGFAGWRTINKIRSLRGTNYWVRPGDSWFTISNKFNVPTWKLKNWNNLYSNILPVGKKLQIPVGTTSTTPSTVSQTVSAGRQVSNEEFDLLARAVYSEARGEPYKGQVAVAAVVLNRVRDPRFPNTVKGVVFEPWAFTAVHDGQFWIRPDDTAKRAVRDALKGWDPTGGAVFYYNPAKVTSHWIYNRRIINRIGKHFFAI